MGGGLSPQVLGFDMAAVLAIGAAMGVSPLAIAELFPGIEREIVQRLNEEAGSGDHEGFDA